MNSNLPFEVTDVFWMIVKVWERFEVIILQGGTNSSKTYSALQWLHLKALEKKRIITICGQDLPNLKGGAYRDFENIINYQSNGIKNHNKSDLTFYYRNGSIIEFKSYDDKQDAKSGKRNILFVNEINGVSKEVYDELADRTDEKIIADYNPTAKFWVHTDLVPQPYAVRLISNYKHNRFLSDSIRRKIERYKTKNPQRWKVYGLGITGQIEGAIFKNVNWIGKDELPHINTLRKFGYGLDYGYVNDPLAMVAAGVQGNRVYSWPLIYEPQLRTSAIANKFSEMQVDLFDLISMDDSQAKEQADVLREVYSYNIKTANRAGGTIKQGIELLQDYELWLVDDEDGNWSAEHDNYIWDPKSVARGNPKPVDKYNHYWDALRYWALEMMTEPELQPYRGNYSTI